MKEVQDSIEYSDVLLLVLGCFTSFFFPVLFSIVITSLEEGRAALYAYRAFSFVCLSCMHLILSDPFLFLCCKGVAALCDCGTPSTFHFTFTKKKKQKKNTHTQKTTTTKQQHDIDRSAQQDPSSFSRSATFGTIDKHSSVKGDVATAMGKIKVKVNAINIPSVSEDRV